MKPIVWALTLLITMGASADPVCAKSYASMYKGPGKDHPVSWKVAKYMPFQKVAEKGSWWKVQDVDGETHWARKQDLSTQLRCVVVKAAVATLRREPSSTAPMSDIKTVDRYTPFKKVDSQREWILVEDETGRQAWIHESLVWKPVKLQTISF